MVFFKFSKYFNKLFKSPRKLSHRDFRSDQYRNNGNNWNGRPNNDGPSVDKFGRNIDRFVFINIISNV